MIGVANPMSLPAAHFQIFAAATSGLSWRFLAANNRSLGQAAGSYDNVESCLAAMHDLRQQLADAECVTAPDGPARWTWRIRSAGLDLAKSSRHYQRRVEAQNAGMLFRTLAQQAEITNPRRVANLRETLGSRAHRGVTIVTTQTVESATRRYVLWGFHPNYGGPRGILPIKISVGTLRQVRADHSQRKAEGGWTLGIYLVGDEPEGLRLQCQEKYGPPRAISA